MHRTIPGHPRVTAVMIALIAMLLLTLIVVVEPAATTSDRDDYPMFQAMSANGTIGSRQSWWWRHKY